MHKMGNFKIKYKAVWPFQDESSSNHAEPTAATRMYSLRKLTKHVIWSILHVRGCVPKL